MGERTQALLDHSLLNEPFNLDSKQEERGSHTRVSSFCPSNGGQRCYISYLLACNKLLQNLEPLNNKHLLSRRFCRSEMWKFQLGIQAQDVGWNYSNLKASVRPEDQLRCPAPTVVGDRPQLFSAGCLNIFLSDPRKEGQKPQCL